MVSPDAAGDANAGTLGGRDQSPAEQQMTVLFQRFSSPHQHCARDPSILIIVVNFFQANSVPGSGFAAKETGSCLLQQLEFHGQPMMS